MSPTEVNILGQSYVLTCPNGGHEHLLRAVSLVNAEMSSIRDAGRVKAREKIAVLAALNLAYQLVEAQAKSKPDISSNFTNFTDVDVNGLIDKIDSTLAPQQTQFF